MPSFRYDRPIPGQSLTSTPRNAPYERLPEIVDPEDAILVHLSNLNKPEAMEGIIEFVNEGFDIQTLVEGITRSAVLSGIHTIDVSLIIAPVIHEFIRTTLDKVGVEYDEGFDDSDEKELQMYTQAKARAAREILELDKRDVPLEIKYEELIQAMSEDVPEGMGQEAEQAMPEEEAPAPAPRRARPSNPDQMELPLEEPTQPEPQQAEPEGRTGLMSRRA